ncbi:uncharacterized protein ARMOST_20445 [Armillaria ostoyae]|uniref:Uncharacterized protein n=1 Tax=Armillaria ostoyae TaxID=47428 RepID=A0A284S7E1_ARMOS|nr:uncharacterized protein ARMOST_20445 [Armillaria ostoyae]
MDVNLIFEACLLLLFITTVDNDRDETTKVPFKRVREQEKYSTRPIKPLFSLELKFPPTASYESSVSLVSSISRIGCPQIVIAQDLFRVGTEKPNLGFCNDYLGTPA